MFVWVSCPILILVGFSSILCFLNLWATKSVFKIIFGVVVGCVLVLKNMKRKRQKESQYWMKKQEKVEKQKQKVKRKSRKTKAKSKK